MKDNHNQQSKVTTPLSHQRGGGGEAVLFPGSFDPFTIGHYNLVERALRLFDEVIIAVGVNERKSGWIPVEERVQAIRTLYNNNACVRVETYTGLTTDFATAVGATAILRGVRSIQDFEYECQMADINRRLTGIETICLFADPALADISSSVVRELAHFGHDIAPYRPPKPSDTCRESRGNKG